MKITNWLTVSGSAEISDGVIKYFPLKFKNQLKKEEISAAIVKSNTEFESGELSFKVILNEKNAVCQVVLNYDSGSIIVVGLNVGSGLFGIAKFDQKNQLDTLADTGLKDTVKLGQPYEIKVTIVGSEINLYVDKILVATAFERVSKSQLTLNFHSNEEITVFDIELNSKKPKAFVVMQFTPEFNDLYTEVIKPIVENYNLTCERADETHTTNPILQDIIQSIKESSVIIADITPNNPNVFYEVGYSHAINKPTILLCDRKRDRLPFDISGFRTLFYDNTIAGKTAVENSLKKYLDAFFRT